MADQRSGFVRRWLVRAGMTFAHRLMMLHWFVTRPRTFGVRAIVLTPAGNVVLLRHSYIRGWYLPGGGRAANEEPEAAILRELREEIGLVDYRGIRHLHHYEHSPTFKRDQLDLFIIEGARYRWTPSLEIEEVSEFDPRALPADIAARSRSDIGWWLATGEPVPPGSP
jgi:8-oxo-dGTP pyrophosphatase MutT (NUDIX family)